MEPWLNRNHTAMMTASCIRWTHRVAAFYWAHEADMFGRFAPIAAPISGHPGTRYAIFFVTRSTTA
jgi:hypothetical protein